MADDLKKMSYMSRNKGCLWWIMVVAYNDLMSFKLAKLGEQLQRFSRKKRETKLIFISLK